MRDNSGAAYSPFDVAFDELESTHLNMLRNVHEGWYVDYKEAPIKPNAYAKAISAMANSYGGWVFIGVKEKSRNDNVAGSFPGVPSEDVDKVCQHIRQAVAEHLNPQPFFEVRPVDAPETTNGSRVICILVPRSLQAPVIHSDGRIYRRVNDASEPVAENSRQAVDHLIARSKEIEDWFNGWEDRDPPLSKYEDDLAYLRILTVPDYWGDKGIWYKKGADEFRELVRGKAPGLSFSARYDSVYPQPRGFICRAVQPDEPSLLRMTLKFSRDLQNEFIVPLPSFRVGDYGNYRPEGSALDDVVGYLIEKGYQDAIAADLDDIFGAVDGFFSLQKRFEEEVGYSGPTLVKFKLCNVWRRVPVLAATPEELRWPEYGIPMVLDSDITIWSGGKPRSFIEMNLHEVEGETENTHAFLSSPMFIRMMMGMGLGAGSEDETYKLFRKAVMNSYQTAIKNFQSDGSSSE